MANWVRYPLPLFWAFPTWRACEVEVRYPPSKGVSQRYLRDTLENTANGCDTSLCDTISTGYCAIWGGISHWAAKAFKTQSLRVGTFKARSLRGFSRERQRGGKKKGGQNLTRRPPHGKQFPHLDTFPPSLPFLLVPFELFWLHFTSLFFRDSLAQ